MKRLFRNLKYDILNSKPVTFIGNIWRFRRVLSTHKWWDYSFTLDTLKTSLQIVSDGIEKKGHEVDEFRLKKVAAMRRCIELIDNHRNNNHLDRAEEILGIKFDYSFNRNTEEDRTKTDKEKADEKFLFQYAHKMEQDEWNEIWDIIKGQKYSQWEMRKEAFTDAERSDYKFMDAEYLKWYDGSGMRGWWD